MQSSQLDRSVALRARPCQSATTPTSTMTKTRPHLISDDGGAAAGEDGEDRRGRLVIGARANAGKAGISRENTNQASAISPSPITERQAAARRSGGMRRSMTTALSARPDSAPGTSVTRCDGVPVLAMITPIVLTTGVNPSG
jgi:hypothetical protein